MTFDLLVHRIFFNETVQKSAYRQGIEHYALVYRKLQAKGLNAVDLTELVEVFAMGHRLAILRGDFTLVESEIKLFRNTYGGKLSPRGEAELVFLEAAIDYHWGYYKRAYDRVKASITQCRQAEQETATGEDCDYILMRMQLLCAKLSWRRDDFFLARIHLGIALYHYQCFNPGFKKVAKTNYFILGRIYTVYTRLLVQRRGPGQEPSNYTASQAGLHNTNTQAAFRALYAADRFFSKDCKLLTKEEREHTFFLEIDELRAVSYRNQARLIYAQDPGRAKLHVQEAQSLLENSLRRIKQLFNSEGIKYHRRIAHLHRLLAENTLLLLLGKIRAGKASSEDLAKFAQAFDHLKEEEKIRKQLEVFGSKKHITKARNVNNQALLSLMQAHLHVANLNTEDMAARYREVIRLAKKAMRVNGVLDTTATGVRKCIEQARLGEEWPFMSGLQLISSIGCLLEAKLRRAELLGAPALRELMGEFVAWYEAAWEVNKLVSRSYGSISAKEDLGRQIRPVHEAVLELCCLTWKEQDERQEARLELVFSIFQRAIAPTVRDRIALERFGSSAKATDEIPVGIQRYSDEVLAIGAIEAKINKEVSEEYGPEPWEALVELYNRGPQRTYGEAPERPSAQLLLKAFNGNAGGVVNFFLGYRHCYLFFYGGRKDKVEWGPGLIRATEEAFRSVHDLKQDIRQLRNTLGNLLRNVDTYCRGTIENNPPVTESKVVKGESGYEQNKLLTSGLFTLHQTLFGGLRFPAFIKRYYLIPDNQLWDIPWPILIRRDPQIAKEGSIDFSTYKYLGQDYQVALHATLNTWKTIGEHDNRIICRYYGAWSGGMYKGDFDDEAELFSKVVFDSAAKFLRRGHEDRMNTKVDIYASLKRDPRFEFFGQQHPGSEVEKFFFDGLKRASIFHFTGHELESNNHYLLKRELNLFQIQENMPAITQFSIEGLKLEENLELVILLSCNAGKGTRETGNLPHALSNAFLFTGVRNMLYGIYHLPTRSAKYFVKCFVESLAQKLPIGEAYLIAQKRTFEKYPHPCQWGLLQLMANQNHTFELKDTKDEN